MTRCRQLFFWSSVRRTVFFDCSSWNFRFNMSKIWLILSNSWVLIWFPYIFSSNSHFFFVKSEFFKMTIVLSWIWRFFFWSFFKLIFLYKCRRNSGLDLINSNINVICSDWGIGIWFPHVFSSNCHIIWRISKFFVCIILARSRWILYLFRRVFTQKKCFIWSAFCVFQSFIDFIFSRSRISVWSEFILIQYISLL